MNRGAGRQAVFRSDNDRQIFYDCRAMTMPRYGVQVHAGCLLGNHFHLLLFSESTGFPTPCGSSPAATRNGSTTATAATARSFGAASLP
jgi:hypothetical protein